MAVTLIEMAPLLHTLFGVVLWLVLINSACYVAAAKFERFSKAVDELPVEDASDEDKIKVLSMFDSAIKGVGMRLAWAAISRNPFKLHLGKPERMFPSLSVDVENRLSNELARTIVMRSPLACALALVLYAATFVGVFLVLLIVAAVAGGHEQPRFSVFPSAFAAYAKSGLQNAARKINNPIIQVVT